MLLGSQFVLLCWALLSARLVHTYEGLSHRSLQEIASIDTQRLALDGADINSHFTHLNKTRTPSSKGSKEVQDYITGHFESLNSQSTNKWEIELDKFEENGLNFTNIVLTKSPPTVSKYLVLAAHYDSLIKIEGFIGAIDSAVSCGILLDIAETLNSLLDKNFDEEEYDLDIGLKIVFFDGEEALVQWGPTDSIYGARHLHDKWKENGTLRDLELFVLLDLLGSQTSTSNYVPSYFPQTHDQYSDLSLLETRLVQAAPQVFSTLQDKYLAPITSDSYIPEYRGYIEDDHIPFLRSKVPILHLIPSRFPPQWHTINDDFQLVDPVAVARWNVLLRAFTAEHLELDLLVDDVIE
jgi:glutaminyl-peptide cyclotransferase